MLQFCDSDYLSVLHGQSNAWYAEQDLGKGQASIWKVERTYEGTSPLIRRSEASDADLETGSGFTSAKARWNAAVTEEEIDNALGKSKVMY